MQNTLSNASCFNWKLKIEIERAGQRVRTERSVPPQRGVSGQRDPQDGAHLVHLRGRRGQHARPEEKRIGQYYNNNHNNNNNDCSADDGQNVNHHGGVRTRSSKRMQISN